MKDEFVKKFTKSIKEADYSELRNIVAEGLQKVSDSLATDSSSKSVKLFYIRKRNWRNYPAMLVRINADGCFVWLCIPCLSSIHHIRTTYCSRYHPGYGTASHFCLPNLSI